MLNRLVRAVAPGPVRRWFQRRKIDRLIANYPRRVVEHRYGDITFKVELADPLADRLMIDTAVIMLFIADRLHWPALAVIVARDALLLVGTRVVLPRGYEFSTGIYVADRAREQLQRHDECAAQHPDMTARER